MTEIKQPRESRGGAIAPADVKIIKEALCAYVKNLDPNDSEVTKIANLLHRLGRIA